MLYTEKYHSNCAKGGIENLNLFISKKKWSSTFFVPGPQTFKLPTWVPNSHPSTFSDFHGISIFGMLRHLSYAPMHKKYFKMRDDYRWTWFFGYGGLTPIDGQ